MAAENFRMAVAMWQRPSFARLAGCVGSRGLLLLAACLLAGGQGPHLMPTPNTYAKAPPPSFADLVDKAIGFSGYLFLSLRRMGQLRPADLTDEQRHHLERIARTQLIDARVPTGFIGHAYFYRHPAVSTDLVLLLRDQLEPGSPGRPLRKRGTNFWQITPDYPNVSGTPSR